MALTKLTKSEKIGAAGFGLGYLSILMVGVSLILLSAIPKPGPVAVALLIAFLFVFLVALPLAAIAFCIVGLKSESKGMCIAGMILALVSMALPLILGLTGSPLSAWTLLF